APTTRPARSHRCTTARSRRGRTCCPSPFAQVSATPAGSTDVTESPRSRSGHRHDRCVLAPATAEQRPGHVARDLFPDRQLVAARCLAAPAAARALSGPAAFKLPAVDALTAALSGPSAAEAALSLGVLSRNKEATFPEATYAALAAALRREDARAAAAYALSR